MYTLLIQSVQFNATESIYMYLALFTLMSKSKQNDRFKKMP